MVDVAEIARVVDVVAIEIAVTVATAVIVATAMIIATAVDLVKTGLGKMRISTITARLSSSVGEKTGVNDKARVDAEVVELVIDVRTTETVETVEIEEIEEIDAIGVVVVSAENAEIVSQDNDYSVSR